MAGNGSGNGSGNSFGFGPNGEDGQDDQRDGNSNQNQNQNQNPEGFDFNEMIRQMQAEFEKMMPGLQSNSANTSPFGFFNPAALFSQITQSTKGATQSALPKDVIREIAKRFIQAHGSQPIGANDQANCKEALSIANTWLDQATIFPQVQSDHPAISPIDWLNNTIDGWHTTFEPLAAGLASAITRLIEEASAAIQQDLQQNPNATDHQALQAQISQMGPMAQILRTFIGSMLATQMGQTIGALASASKGAHDAGLPIGGNKPSLLPQTLRKFGEDLEIPDTEIAIYFALREAATVRLFESNPWLVSYMNAAIAEYGKGIHIDLDAIQRQAEEAMQGMQGMQDPQNPNGEANSESFTIALNNGLFTPEETAQQAAALEKLETALALIDGWVEEVITLAAGNRLPSLVQLSELLRRERVSNSPIQQLFKALFNLEVSPRQIREATFFWSEVRALNSSDSSESAIANRDKIWSGLLPTAKDLTDPIGFVTSTAIPDDLSGL
jgi:putative hydrolase